MRFLADYLRWVSAICVLAGCGLVGRAGLADDTPNDSRPNIIVILSDDMGYSDIGCYGGEIKTPNLDRMAANGLRFTQFYNTGRCCPTRASLLTGLYPHQAGVGWMVEDEGVPGYRGEMNRNSVTIAEVLRAAGYGTYQVGKWHVTQKVNPQAEDEKFNWPLQRGFDHCYGLINGASSMWDPNSLIRDNQLITCRNDTAYQPSQPYHVTDAFADNACSFVAQHDFDTKPMFMYVAFTAAHWPLHARPETIAKYDGVYDNGYEAIRQSRLVRMKELGVISQATTITNRSGDWDKVPDKVWEAACMEVYAAMIDQMDSGIGRLVQQLEERGQLDNTIILFMQDNGGCQEGAGRDPNPKNVSDVVDAAKFKTIPDDVLHYFTSRPNQTRDGRPVKSGHVMPGPADTFLGYGQNWANVSNTPLREYKHFVHEGGISTPLVVQWPKGIAAKNELRHEPSHLIDIMATCIDLADASYPTEFKGNKIIPMEGTSLHAAFENKTLERETLFWEHEGNRAIRMGNWKLVAKGKMKDRELPVKWELYDIAIDRNENNDLSRDNPELVLKMSEMWDACAHRTSVYPCPKPVESGK